MKYLKLNYPKYFNETENFPKEIYFSGKTPVFSNTVLILGSKTHSKYSEDICKKIIKELSPYPVNILTELDIGIPKIAIKTAIKEKINLICVTDEKFNEIDESINLNLFNAVKENDGSILSTCDKSIENKIIMLATMSDIVVVIDCESKSLTQLVINLAIEYGRDVCAVPRDVYSKGAYSTNFLIKQGAHLIDNGNDIIEILGIK